MSGNFLILGLKSNIQVVKCKLTTVFLVSIVTDCCYTCGGKWGREVGPIITFPVKHPVLLYCISVVISYVGHFNLFSYQRPLLFTNKTALSKPT